MLNCVLCSKEYHTNSKRWRCLCGGPLQLSHLTGTPGERGDIWSRYREFFPYVISKSDSCGEGDTPLTYARGCSKDLGVELYLKNETVNPTWSFKDRGTLMGVKDALHLGYERVGVVSTGNMAASVAAYGAYHQLKTLVLVTSDIGRNKLEQISVYGPDIVAVDGDYGDLYFESLKIGEQEGIYFINSDNPYRIEGYKSIAYELASEDVDHVLVPTSSGGLFRGIVKGYEELEKSDIIDDIPKFTAVQAKGCAPIYRAFVEEDLVEPWKEIKTLAKAISNPYPPSGDAVIKKSDDIGGTVVAVEDDDIISAQKKIAKKGIYCQPASAVGIAALPDLIGDFVEKGSKVVSVVTGSGLKVRNRSSKSSLKRAKLHNIIEVI